MYPEKSCTAGTVDAGNVLPELENIFPSNSPPKTVMRNTLEEKFPDTHCIDYCFHNCSSDCRAQRRELSTKRKASSWIYVSSALAQPDSNSTETLSDGQGDSSTCH